MMMLEYVWYMVMALFAVLGLLTLVVGVPVLLIRGPAISKWFASTDPPLVDRRAEGHARLCAECGEPIQRGWRFCPSCGTEQHWV